MEKIVNETESFCNVFESLSPSITDRIIIERFVLEPVRLSVPATSANIRMFYYVTQKHYPKDSMLRGFEQLRFLLTDPRSGWSDLTDDEKVSLLRHTRDIYNDVFVFSSRNKHSFVSHSF